MGLDDRTSGSVSARSGAGFALPHQVDVRRAWAIAPQGRPCAPGRSTPRTNCRLAASTIKSDCAVPGGSSCPRVVVVLLLLLHHLGHQLLLLLLLLLGHQLLLL